MTVLKINDLDLDKISEEDFNKIINSNMQAYYEKHFQNNKSLHKKKKITLNSILKTLTCH